MIYLMLCTVIIMYEHLGNPWSTISIQAAISEEETISSVFFYRKGNSGVTLMMCTVIIMYCPREPLEHNINTNCYL